MDSFHSAQPQSRFLKTVRDEGVGRRWVRRESSSSNVCLGSVLRADDPRWDRTISTG